ncbi:MAG: TIM barrel protein [Candidatus Saccharibacteria bacterium]|nr:MAG: TIM barrel protein [Candidatus Saccharibacteria bacterium]
MKLAVSSIAWTNEEEEAIASKLQELGVRHVEIAPTKLWDDPTMTTAEDAKRYVEWWAQRGITVSAFQSMLFARPDLTIFESAEIRTETINYMSRFLELAGVMGAKKLVFGSPKNRRRGDMDLENATSIATDFFGTLGDVAAREGVVLCLEPNAPQYNCDFITNAAEGAELVRRVNNPGFGLHLDTACMALAGDDLGDSIRNFSDILEHFHISSPMLGQVEDLEEVDHRAAARALNDINYDKILSIEMRPGDAGTNVECLEKAVRFVQSVYDIDK